MMPKIHNADCLDAMSILKDGSVDMILTDLPYGITYARWDTPINLELLWQHYKRIIKPHGAIVLFAAQPFTSKLVSSNYEWFRYQWVWDKANPTNFPNAKRQPLKQHEDILVFYGKQSVYNPQMTVGKPNHKQGLSRSKGSTLFKINTRNEDNLSGLKYPRSILQFPKHSSYSTFHATEKPMPLLEYLIKTYTSEGDLVVDSCAGSGSTAIACLNTKRDYWICEIDTAYCQIAEKRISERLAMLSNQIEAAA